MKNNTDVDDLTGRIDEISLAVGNTTLTEYKIVTTTNTTDYDSTTDNTTHRYYDEW